VPHGGISFGLAAMPHGDILSGLAAAPHGSIDFSLPQSNDRYFLRLTATLPPHSFLCFMAI
jgi:hypothetical protein